MDFLGFKVLLFLYFKVVEVVKDGKSGFFVAKSDFQSDKI